MLRTRCQRTLESCDVARNAAGQLETSTPSTHSPVMSHHATPDAKAAIKPIIGSSAARRHPHSRPLGHEWSSGDINLSGCRATYSFLIGQPAADRVLSLADRLISVSACCTDVLVCTDDGLAPASLPARAPSSVLPPRTCTSPTPLMVHITGLGRGWVASIPPEPAISAADAFLLPLGAGCGPGGTSAAEMLYHPLVRVPCPVPAPLLPV